MPSNHLILCRPLLLPPSIFPSIRVFSSESALSIRRPKDWSFSFSISPSSEYSGLISIRMDWLDLLAVHGTLIFYRGDERLVVAGDGGQDRTGLAEGATLSKDPAEAGPSQGGLRRDLRGQGRGSAGGLGGSSRPCTAAGRGPQGRSRVPGWGRAGHRESFWDLLWNRSFPSTDL